MMSGLGKAGQNRQIYLSASGRCLPGGVGCRLDSFRDGAMIRTHERVLVEVRRQATAEREAYRRLLEREQHMLARYRSAPRLARPEEHRASLRAAKRLAREGLDAHRRALEQNRWILQLVALYEQLQALRRSRVRRKEKAEQPVAQELLPSPQGVG